MHVYLPVPVTHRYNDGGRGGWRFRVGGWRVRLRVRLRVQLRVRQGRCGRTRRRGKDPKVVFIFMSWLIGAFDYFLVINL